MTLNISLTQYNIENHVSYNSLSSTLSKDSSMFQPSLSEPSQNSDNFSLEHFNTPKLGDSCTKSDVLLQLWRDTHTINMNDSSYSGGLCFDPTEEDLDNLVQQMKLSNLNGQIDFSKISNDFANIFSTVHAGNLGDAIDYLASRAVALKSQINRNYDGEELKNQSQLLDNVIQQGKNELIDSYAGRIQDALSLSDSDTQEIRSSLEALIEQRLQTYQDVQSKMSDTLTGTKDEWLLNQDQYMASQLRDKTNSISDNAIGGNFNLADLRAAGELAGAYQDMYQKVAQGSGGDESFLALDLSMVDMKMETLIYKGIVSEKMATVLRSSLDQRHQDVMDTADQRLSVRREEALSGDGPIPNLNRELFQSIYDVILNSFHENDGNALTAIQDGVFFGKTATTHASQENPKVSRWGVSKDNYWDKFYTSIQTSDLYGNTRIKKSEYQKYADSWQHFLSTISSPNGRFLSSSSQAIPSYNQHFINTIA